MATCMRKAQPCRVGDAGVAPRRPTINRGADPAEDGFYVVSPHDGGWALADCLIPSELPPGVSGERMARAG